MNALIFAYIAVVLFIGLIGAVGAYHATKYGLPGDKTRPALLIYVVAFALIVIASFVFIGTADLSGEATT